MSSAVTDSPLDARIHSFRWQIEGYGCSCRAASSEQTMTVWQCFGASSTKRSLRSSVQKHVGSTALAQYKALSKTYPAMCLHTVQLTAVLNQMLMNIQGSCKPRSEYARPKAGCFPA
eukprot:GHRR01008203.1.p1 GENE.GHRR01008203.1~~GHRR01008203.1.p1  ORF type:complete len:117 (+),score=13.40 GHRR01008203.1:271-621(+)